MIELLSAGDPKVEFQEFRNTSYIVYAVSHQDHPLSLPEGASDVAR